MKNSKLVWTVVIALITLVVIGYLFKWPIIMNNWWVLVFLLCPLMHLFMGHGGHGEEHGSGHHNESTRKEGPPEPKQGKSCH